MIYTLTLNPAVDKELTVPALEQDTVLRATASRVDVGGKGFNVSRMLANLGAANTAVALAGGRSGEFLREGLEALGISTAFIEVAGETRSNVSIVCESGPGYMKVNEPGPRVSEQELEALLARISALAGPGDWWVLSGSLPPGVPADVYARTIKLVQEKGGKAILDSSGDALRLGCRARPFLVKPNAFEAAEMILCCGSAADIDPEAMAQQVRALGPRNVLLSLGEAGALLVTPQRTWRMESHAVTEANPIGAGDSLLAGLVYGLERDMAWPEALRWGLACGAATASLQGTAVGTREQVEGLLTADG